MILVAGLKDRDWGKRYVARLGGSVMFRDWESVMFRDWGSVMFDIGEALRCEMRGSVTLRDWEKELRGEIGEKALRDDQDDRCG